MAEEAYSSSNHAGTEISRICANWGFELSMYWPMDIHFRNPESEYYGHHVNGVDEKPRERLADLVEMMKTHYNMKWHSMDQLKKGDFLMLKGWNIRAKNTCNKLVVKSLGPFNVFSIGGNLQYCKLKLPDLWKIHPGFNVDQHERYGGTYNKKQVIEIEEESDDWKMYPIIASGPSDNYSIGYVNMVKWKVFVQEETTWEIYQTVADIYPRLLEDYYNKNTPLEQDGRYNATKESE